MPDFDFEGLAAVLIQRAGELLPAWLPGGKMRGREYITGGLRGGPGDSMSVNMNTGKWADFASDDLKGGDLISLYAAIEGIGQGDAAKRLSERVGFRLTNEPVKTVVQQPKEHKLTPPPADAEVPSFLHPSLGKPVGTWRYTDVAGATLFYVARYQDKGGKKTFLPWSWSTEGYWVQKGWPAPRPLYGLELLKARPDAPCLVVEGEKAAEAARTLAGHVYVVVTWPNGAQAANKADFAPLAGRKVLIWPDADAPGNKAADFIAKGLSGVCSEVKVLDVSGQPDGWDAADAAAEGWTWAKVVEWAKPRAKVFGQVVQATAVAKSNGATADAQVNVTVSAEPQDADASLYALYEEMGIALTGQGNPICNVDNALRVIERYEPLKDLIWFDEFHRKYFTRWNSPTPREWEDVDTLNLTAIMQRDLALRRMSDDMIYKAAVVFAHKHVKNDPRDWMSGLTWDGVERCGHFFIDCFGAEENDYTLAVGRNFWTGMAARIFKPGCQLDNMVVLEGGQGIGKTRALRLLGGPWYAEAHESVTSNDFFMILHGKMIVEIAELDAFSRAEVTRIKQVVTCTTDRYRAPYGRTAQDHPRMSIFVGTTNEHAYLRDNTGGRRFWPVKCGDINHDLIAQNREQLFAEAVARFKAGDKWYEMPAEATLAEQEARRHVDEWEGAIYDFLLQRDEVSIRELAADCLKIEVGKLDTGIQMRVGRVLRALNWSKHTKWTAGAQGKVWRRNERLGD